MQTSVILDWTVSINLLLSCLMMIVQITDTSFELIGPHQSDAEIHIDRTILSAICSLTLRGWVLCLLVLQLVFSTCVVVTCNITTW